VEGMAILGAMEEIEAKSSREREIDGYRWPTLNPIDPTNLLLMWPLL
jgi:hypothetical protein